MTTAIPLVYQLSRWLNDGARVPKRRVPELAALHDWRRAAVGPSAPCILCKRPALMREPVEHHPCHKVCADSLLRTGAEKGIRL
jgi:hypothetical protein